MDTWIWIVIALAVIAVVAAVLVLGGRKRRTSHLQSRFGSEYDRTIEKTGDRGDAESELLDRERRYEDLDIRPLSAAARQRYSEEWDTSRRASSTTREGAVGAADRLVQQVMNERAIPAADNFERRAADVSMDYPDVVENYREVHGLWDRYSRDDDNGQTEDLRQAMVHFRLLFEELLVSDRVEQEVR